MTPRSTKSPKLILTCGPLSCNRFPPGAWLCLQPVFFDAHKNLKTLTSQPAACVFENSPSPYHQQHCEGGRILSGCDRSSQGPLDQPDAVLNRV